MPPWCKIQNYYLYVQSMGATPAPSLELIKWRGQKILSRQHSWLKRVGWEKWFDLDIWTLDLKINWDHQPLHQVWYWSSEWVKRYWADNTVGWEEWFDLTFEHVTRKSIGIIYSLRTTPAPSLVLIKWMGSKDIKQTTQWAEKSGLTWLLNMWPENQYLRDHILIEGNPCTKFGIDQVKGSKYIKQTKQWAEKRGLTLTFEHVTWKSIGIIYSLRATPTPSLVMIKWRGSKDIERTTQWAEKSGLTLTFEHVTRKSIGIIYSLRATPAPSLVLIKWRSQKILSGQHLVYRPTDRPTYRPTVAKQYAQFFKGGITTV